LLRHGVAQATIAKPYWLLHAVLTTAVEDDQLLVHKPAVSEGDIGKTR
jgi:hypothetical protein